MKVEKISIFVYGYSINQASFKFYLRSPGTQNEAKYLPITLKMKIHEGSFDQYMLKINRGLI